MICQMLICLSALKIEPCVTDLFVPFLAGKEQLVNPVKQGMMWKEGHRRKTWKERYCVVWPADFEDRGMSAPVLFYYDPEGACSNKFTQAS